jgi:hypothetical protein
MNALTTYFFGLLAYNVAFAALAFAAVHISMRKFRELVFGRGVAVVLIGWIAGSLLILAIHLLFALNGTDVQGSQLETPVSIIGLLSVTYAAYGWLSKKRAVIVS